MFLLRVVKKLSSRMLFELLIFSLFSKLRKTPSNSCLLVYSSTFERRLLTTAFDLT